MKSKKLIKSSKIFFSLLIISLFTNCITIGGADCITDKTVANIHSVKSDYTLFSLRTSLFPEKYRSTLNEEDYNHIISFIEKRDQKIFTEYDYREPEIKGSHYEWSSEWSSAPVYIGELCFDLFPSKVLNKSVLILAVQNKIFILDTEYIKKNIIWELGTNKKFQKTTLADCSEYFDCQFTHNNEEFLFNITIN